MVISYLIVSRISHIDIFVDLNSSTTVLLIYIIMHIRTSVYLYTMYDFNLHLGRGATKSR